MKTNLKKWFRVTKSEILYGGLFMSIFGFALLFIEISKSIIRTKNDLVFISGPFNEYTWINSSTGRNGSRLTFSLQNYNKRFQVIADFYNILNKEKFKVIPKGEPLTIAISKSSEKDMPSTKTLRVYSITAKDEVFLDHRDAIENQKRNNILSKIFSVLFIAIGIFCIYLVYKWRRNNLYKSN